MSSLSKHVIHQPKPFRQLIIVILVAILTFSVQWFVQQTQSTTDQQHIQQLEDENKALAENSKTSTLASKQHYSQKLALEQATTAQLQVQISSLQEQVLTLNKELLFYQTVTQGNSSSKLQIRELDLRADPSRADIVRYRIVMTQGKKINKPITGTINVLMNSDNKGTAEQYTIEQHPLSLRHVQVLEGQIKIEDDTTPLTLTVDLIQNKKITLSRTFDWQLASDN